MKTSELTGAQLEYWTARAEGTPADSLAVIAEKDGRPAQCVYTRIQKHRPIGRNMVVNFSSSWEWGGPLIEKHNLYLDQLTKGEWYSGKMKEMVAMEGPSPLIAICRAVVRSVFGDEVPDD